MSRFGFRRIDLYGTLGLSSQTAYYVTLTRVRKGRPDYNNCSSLSMYSYGREHSYLSHGIASTIANIGTIIPSDHVLRYSMGPGAQVQFLHKQHGTFHRELANNSVAHSLRTEYLRSWADGLL